MLVTAKILENQKLIKKIIRLVYENQHIWFSDKEEYRYSHSTSNSDFPLNEIIKSKYYPFKIE